MTFTARASAFWILRHGGAVQVEAFYRGYGLRLSDGRLMADRTGSSPETFDTRAAAERGAQSLRK